jgi:cation diffusion facilitator family transporter
MNEARLQHSLRAIGSGLAVNALMAVGKLTAGILGHSYALIADAVESTADIFSSLIVWRGMVIAHQPADADHPYGHGRAETLAAAAVALMLLAAAVVIFVQSVREIVQPHQAPAPFTLVVLLAVVLIKEGLFRFVGGIGEEIESSAVTTDAWHHRSDAITSATAALGISVSLLGGPRFAAADEWAALFAAVIITWNGWRLFRPALRELMDTAPAEDVIVGARAAAATVPGVAGLEKCFGRQMGYGYVLDMHVRVDGAMSVATAHRIAHQVQDAVRARLPRVVKVLVHIEPQPDAAPPG